MRKLLFFIVLLTYSIVLCSCSYLDRQSGQIGLESESCEVTKEQYDFFSYKVNTVLCEEGRSISKKRLERKLGSIELKDLLEILKIKEYIFIEKKI